LVAAAFGLDRAGKSGQQAADRREKSGEMVASFLSIARAPGQASRETLLGAACAGGQLEAVQLLLGSGAALDSKDRDGESVVHAAIRGEDTDILAIILEAGADPNIPSYLGKFPLHLAVERNLLAVVRQMAEHGVDLEARDQVAGRTALHLAVDRQLEEMVRYLVKEAKVDLSREDYSGTTALSFAESCRNQNILRLLTKGARKQK